MNRVELREMYIIPESYQPPDISELPTNTMYPNLNSTQYRHKPVDIDEIKLYRYCDLLEVNATGTVVLATNNYNGRLWFGSIWGYRTFDDVIVPNKELFKLKLDATVTNIRFYDNDMVILTTASGDIQLWSTQSVVRNAEGYSLYNIAKKSEHIGMTLSMDLLGPKNERAITGASCDNSIKIWNIGPCDLVSEYTFRDAHFDAVTGLSSKPQDRHIFASCSRDRSIAIWDHRKETPAINFHEGSFGYTAINWSIKDGKEVLFAGDVTGQFHIIDPRNFKENLQTIKIIDRPVHKIKPNLGDGIAILSQSNSINVIDRSKNYSNIYSNESAIDFVRDVYWKTDRHFYSVGWDQQLSSHTL